MSTFLSAELAATCNALGYFDPRTDKYHADSNTLETVKDLIRYLRRDNDTHDVRRQIGETKVLQADLIPLLINYWEETDLFDVLLSPSPAKYNVASEAKSRCVLFPHTERFLKKVSPTACSESGSIQSAPCFQTPNIPKKKRILNLSLNKKKTVDIEEFNEKIVECNNKDACIKELTEEVEDLKIQAASYQRENEEIKSSNDNLKSRLHETQTELQEIKHKYEEILKIVRYNDELIDNLQEKGRHCEEEIRDLTNKCAEGETELLKIREEFEARIKLIQENFHETSLLSEMQTKQKIEEIESDWKFRLEEKEKEAEAILRECQAISEYNIIQCELEKNQLKTQLLERERRDDCPDFMEKLKQTEELLEEKRKYEITVNTLQNTIEVLKKRLINSDHDVEQLKEELSSYENQVITNENKCTNLLIQLDEVKSSNEELEMQMELLLNNFQVETKKLEEKLMKRAEDLENNLKSQYEAQILLDSQLLQEMSGLLSDSNKILENVREENQRLENSVSQLQTEVRIKNDALDSSRKESLEAVEVRKHYIDISGKYDEMLQKHEVLMREFERMKEINRQLQVQSEQINLSGLYEQNMELSSKNYDLKLMVDKLQKETSSEFKKQNKKVKIHAEDKENLGSPRRIAVIGSPGPLKEKN